MNGQIPADASDALMSRNPDGWRSSAEYLLVAGTKQWNEKALPWILDFLGPFEEETLVGHILEEIAKPCSCDTALYRHAGGPITYEFCCCSADSQTAVDARKYT